MKVLILEANLLWSTKVARMLAASGIETEVRSAVPSESDAMIAIINLGERTPVEIESLKQMGMKILAHAGHKETELLDLGKATGCDRIATNSAIAHKLPQILQEMMGEG
jgi:hypothetical protein